MWDPALDLPNLEADDIFVRRQEPAYRRLSPVCNGRFDGGGMRYLRFTNWLGELERLSGPIAAIWFEEVRRHVGTDAAHVYGGLMATLTAWAELRGVPYQGVPVGTIKRHATGKGNANKDAMIVAARARGFSPADDNEADAIAILLWAMETRGGAQ